MKDKREWKIETKLGQNWKKK